LIAGSSLVLIRFVLNLLEGTLWKKSKLYF
jgi:hypothetical protein